MNFFWDLPTSPFDSNVLLSELESRFSRVFHLFEQVGIHPQRPNLVYNPYTDSFSTKLFTNIGEHCIAVAYAASKIMNALVVSGVASRNDLNQVIERALIHDLSKPYEIMQRDALGRGFVCELHSANAHNHLRAILQKIGFNTDDANYMVTAGSETGHDSLKDFIICAGQRSTDLVSGRIVEKVVHLADDMTFTSIPSNDKIETTTTLFLTPGERISASRFAEQYPGLWREGLALTAEGKIVHVEEAGNCCPGLWALGNYASIQIKVARAIAQEFQQAIDPGSKLDPEQYLKQLINKFCQTR